MKYAIIPAHGHCGTHGIVYRSLGTKEMAVEAALKYNNSGPHKVQVVECALPKGASISMRFVGNLYPVVELTGAKASAVTPLVATMLAIGPL